MRQILQIAAAGGPVDSTIMTPVKRWPSDSILAFVAATLLFCGMMSCTQHTSEQDEQRPIVIFVASSLADVVQAACVLPGAPCGDEILISAGSSAALARQIQSGAPVDVFITADPQWVEVLADDALTITDTTKTICGNRLVIASRSASKDPATIASVINDSPHIALGDPDTTPVGRYGRQALESLDLWNDVRPRLRSAHDARSAVRLFELGEADALVCYATDIAEPDGDITMIPIPESEHDPIVYIGVRCSEHPRADACLTWLTSSQAQALLARHGFVVTAHAKDNHRAAR